MGKLIIKKPGLFTTIQDGGRMGYRKYGIPISGAMDQQSAGQANLLVNNDANQALLEITMNGPEILLEAEGILALAGADLSPQLDGQSIPMNSPVSFAQGQQLSFGNPRYGIRTYLAIHGGLKSPKVLNSRSQYYPVTPSERLQKEDQIEITSSDNSVVSNASLKVDKALFSTSNLQVYKGPEFDLLTGAQQQLLFEGDFTIAENNRMGYQIKSTGNLKNQLHMITAPVIPGTVQLTPSGSLIVLMRDGQVTGGYPRILQLHPNSINRLVQKTTGMKINFTSISAFPDR